MARRIMWDGKPFALLVEGDDGPFLVPPIVFNEEGEPVEGREVLAAIVLAGVAVKHPVVRGASVADLAEIDQRMARISEELGVPIGPPD